MYLVVANHLELIFFPLTSPKCDLIKVEKAMFEELAWHSQLIFGLWNAISIKLKNVTFKKFSTS